MNSSRLNFFRPSLCRLILGSAFFVLLPACSDSPTSVGSPDMSSPPGPGEATRGPVRRPLRDEVPSAVVSRRAMTPSDVERLVRESDDGRARVSLHFKILTGYLVLAAALVAVFSIGASWRRSTHHIAQPASQVIVNERGRTHQQAEANHDQRLHELFDGWLGA